MTQHMRAGLDQRKQELKVRATAESRGTGSPGSCGLSFWGRELGEAGGSQDAWAPALGYDQGQLGTRTLGSHHWGGGGGVQDAWVPAPFQPRGVIAAASRAAGGRGQERNSPEAPRDGGAGPGAESGRARGLC